MFASAPRYESFYALFKRAGVNVEQATVLLAELVADWPDDDPGRRFELKELETEGDHITHDVIHRLNVKAATPFPVADAHALISAVDDVVDLAEGVGDFMGLYRIEAATEQAIELSGVLERAGRELAAALASLRRPNELRPRVVALRHLEHEGDRLERGALTALFDGGIDPMVVIRWKDIYERLEDAIDACHHAGNALEGLLVRSPAPGRVSAGSRAVIRPTGGGVASGKSRNFGGRPCRRGAAGSSEGRETRPRQTNTGASRSWDALVICSA